MGFLGKGGARLRRGLIVVGVLGAAGPLIATAGAAEQAPAYELVHGCYAVQAKAAGTYLQQDGAGWNAAAKDAGTAEPFRMQATALGRFLFFGKGSDFLAGTSGGALATEQAGSETSDWKVTALEGGGFRISLPAAGRTLSAGPDGSLSLVADTTDRSDATTFLFAAREGCAVFPEITTNVKGDPSRGATEYSETRGFLDGHLHHMAFEFLGGSVHCGRPWHRYGVARALPDCNGSDPANGIGRVPVAAALGGTPSADQVGWPTFNSWPKYDELAYEGTYWKWMERAWQGGLRLFTNLLVDNAALCDIYPFKAHSCNEMDTVRLELKRTFELQDYIDAQYGGPGKGFYRIVKDPIEARKVINDGKLAVILGIEISSLFNCGVYNDQPQCDRAQIDAQLNEMHNAGVRQMELVNKFDNALAGVAGDAGETGLLVNSANKMKTGKFWDFQTCPGDGHDHDREQFAVPGYSRDELAGQLVGGLVPAGAAPVYPAAPHCNTRGLSALGAFLIRRMMEKGMLFDPDHMSVLARDQALTVIESGDYSGVLSSHSWSDPSSLPRIYRQGGVVTPYAGSSSGFVSAWKDIKKQADPRYYFGFGYGADMNGFGTQGPPRPNATENPVTYPFKSFDGRQTIDKQVSGQQEYDINVDGVAHYGLYPDWIEDLRKIAGDGIIEDMARGPEAFLQTWERAVGIPADGTRPKGSTFARRSLGAVQVHDTWERLLRRAGQPDRRLGRVYTYGVAGAKNAKARVRAVFTRRGRVGLVTSTSKDHRAGGLRVGDRASKVRGRTIPFGPGVRARKLGRGAMYLYGVRSGKVAWVAVTATSVAKTPAGAKRYLKLAGLR